MSVIPKTEQRRRRLGLVVVLVFGVGTAVLLLLFSNKSALNMFYDPTEIAEGKAPTTRRIDVGGMVVKGSKKLLADGVTVQFVVSDFKNQLTVQFKGILPDMVAEGKGAVAKGKLNKKGILVADKVTAKHDEKYEAPPIRKMLRKQKQAKLKTPK